MRNKFNGNVYIQLQNNHDDRNFRSKIKKLFQYSTSFFGHHFRIKYSFKTNSAVLHTIINRYTRWCTTG